MKRPGEIAFLSILFLVACFTSTELTYTWVNPAYNAETAKPFTKVLVVAKVIDDSTSKMAEDKIASKFLSGWAVQSYQYLDVADTNQVEIESKLKEDEFDGIIRMDFIQLDTKAEYRVDPILGGYGAGWYYGVGTPYPAIPGYFSENQTFIIQTSIYSLEPSTMIWTGRTETVDPANLRQTMNEIIQVVKDDLISKGIIKENVQTNK